MSSAFPFVGDTPFHRGERAIQSRLGVRNQIEEIGRRFIRDHMLGEHRQFYASLPFLLLGTRDGAGQPWASIVSGTPGFLHAPDGRRLDIAALPPAGDPAREHLAAGSPVGLLGIEFASRRRNRMNGRVREAGETGFSVAVDQSFGNCPMYIQARHGEPAVPAATAASPEAVFSLTGATAALITASDAFFIATQYTEGESDDGALRPTDGVDVSHRGGKPGFVRIEDEKTLVWPDFTGNMHFNTLGNILLEPRAGLLFMDFESGDLIQLAGTAEILWEGDELDAFTGAERLVRFRLERGHRLPAALPFRWTFEDYSPVLEQTGSWEAVADTLRARAQGNRVVGYSVDRVELESEGIKSFYLRPADGSKPPAHLAGQFLPVEIPGEDGSVLRRTYTISNAPNGEFLRLSVKRELPASPEVPPGRSSNWFHDHVRAGSVLRALGPRGTFTLEADSARPVVLISAGVGITPMLAMLEQLLTDQEGCGVERPVWFIHGARNGREHAFARRVRALQKRCEGLFMHIAYSRPDESDRPGKDYDSRGRVSVDLLKSVLPFDHYEFYLCGPGPFMETLYEGLAGLGVEPARLHYEFFGPATRLGGDPADAAIPTDTPEDAATVEFRSSGVAGDWTRASGTLLDLAEAEGLKPLHSCRSGICQTCATPVIAGEVTYGQAPMTPPPEGQALICCSYPKASAEKLVLDL